MRILERAQMIKSVKIERFKSIHHLEVELGEVTVLVGPNNAGKSSVLQALQFATSLCQSLALDNVSRWRGNKRTGTLASEQLIYTPLRDVHTLAEGGRLRQDPQFAINIELINEIDRSLAIQVTRGKNKNISCSLTGKELGQKVSDLDDPFSVVAPGLAGIPAVEEYRAKGLVRRAAARGDANSVFRNVLWALRQNEASWGEFHQRLSRVFPDLEVEVKFDEDNGESIDAQVKMNGIELPIDSVGTGVLQAIQVLAYVGLYRPDLIILDEPDSHLHPDNQRKLARLLGDLAHNGEVQVVFSTHSRHVLDEVAKFDAKVHWMSDGELRGADFTLLSGLLELGALDAGDRLRAGQTRCVIITEDTNLDALKTLLVSSGFDLDACAIWSYGSSSKLESAMLLARFIFDVASDTRVIVHRDRDYMTVEEVEGYRSSLEGIGVVPFVTEGTDIESHYVDSGHLKSVYPSLSVDDLDAAINQATADTEEYSLRIMISTLSEDASRARSRGKIDNVDHGKIALQAMDDYRDDPKRFRHGKKVMRRLRAILQESHRVQGDPYRVSSAALSVPALAAVAQELGS